MVSLYWTNDLGDIATSAGAKMSIKQSVQCSKHKQKAIGNGSWAGWALPCAHCPQVLQCIARFALLQHSCTHKQRIAVHSFEVLWLPYIM